MGCDIHSFAEVKDNNGKWNVVKEEVFTNPHYRKEDPQEGWNKPYQVELYSGRNYDLFAILANVRNGYGFAGVNTGEGFKPISEPKGLPDDISKTVKESAERWDEDGHSHSWFTVKELKEYDWHQLTMKRGVISLDQYKIFKDTGGYPEMWSGGISGQEIITISEEDADKILDESVQKDPDLIYYVSYRWGIRYIESCKHFVEIVIPELEALGNQEDVRIVFWFDN